MFRRYFVILFLIVIVIEVLLSYLYPFTRIVIVFMGSIMTYYIVGSLMGRHKADLKFNIIILTPFIAIKLLRIVENSDYFFPMDSPILLILSLSVYGIGFYQNYYQKYNYSSGILTLIIICTTVLTAEFVIPQIIYQKTVKSESYLNDDNFQLEKWSLLTVEGDVLPISKFDNKAILLNFTFSRCGPCIEKQPSLKWLNDKIDKSKIAIIEVDLGDFDTLAEAKVFSDKGKHNLYWAYDPENKLANKFNIIGAPHQVIISKNRDEVEISHGFSTTFVDLYQERTLEKLKELADK